MNRKIVLNQFRLFVDKEKCPYYIYKKKRIYLDIYNKENPKQQVVKKARIAKQKQARMGRRGQIQKKQEDHFKELLLISLKKDNEKYQNILKKQEELLSKPKLIKIEEKIDRYSQKGDKESQDKLKKYQQKKAIYIKENTIYEDKFKEIQEELKKEKNQNLQGQMKLKEELEKLEINRKKQIDELTISSKKTEGIQKEKYEKELKNRILIDKERTEMMDFLDKKNTAFQIEIGAMKKQINGHLQEIDQQRQQVQINKEKKNLSDVQAYDLNLKLKEYKEQIKNDEEKLKKLEQQSQYSESINVEAMTNMRKIAGEMAKYMKQEDKQKIGNNTNIQDLSVAMLDTLKGVDEKMKIQEEQLKDQFNTEKNLEIEKQLSKKNKQHSLDILTNVYKNMFKNPYYETQNTHKGIAGVDDHSQRMKQKQKEFKQILAEVPDLNKKEVKEEIRKLDPQKYLLKTVTIEPAIVSSRPGNIEIDLDEMIKEEELKQEVPSEQKQQIQQQGVGEFGNDGMEMETLIQLITIGILDRTDDEKYVIYPVFDNTKTYPSAKDNVIFIFLRKIPDNKNKKNLHFTVAVYTRDDHEIAFFDPLSNHSMIVENVDYLKKFVIQDNLMVKLKHNGVQKKSKLQWQDNPNDEDSYNSYCAIYCFCFLQNYILLNEEYLDAIEWNNEDEKSLKQLTGDKSLKEFKYF